ncbi:MAG TPA: murein biosynthesis integral membrane protein MurJ [Methylomirabilota bacterium]
MTETRHTVEGQVVRALGSIGVATLASRILGFGRDMVVALVFGAGPVTDAFFVAFRIPNILRRLLAEGALSTAVIPVFTDYLVNRPRDEFLRMLRAVLAAALAVLTAITVLGMLSAPWLVPLIAPGFTGDEAQRDLTVSLTRTMFPYLLLVGLSALAMGVLNAHGRFFASALGPAVQNVGIILSVLALATRVSPPIMAVAVGVLVGGLGQLLVQIPDLQRSGTLLAPAPEWRHPALGRIARLLLPAVFGLAAVQVTVFVNTLLASLLPPGSISFLYYADRVMEFPLGVFGIALASASLPAMSRQAAAGDTRALAGTLNFALRLSLYVAWPATVGLVLFRTPITRVLFERGHFSAEDTVATAYALACYALGLPAFSAARIAAQAFYAVRAPGTAVRLGVLSVVANVVAAFALMGPLGHGGLALASSIGAYDNLVTLVWAARRRFGRMGGRALLASTVRTLALSVPMIVWCLAVLAWWPTAASFHREALWLAAGVGGGAALFLIAGRLARAPEAVALLRMLPGRGRE